MYFRSNRGTPEPDSLSYQGEDETTGGMERKDTFRSRRYLFYKLLTQNSCPKWNITLWNRIPEIIFGVLATGTKFEGIRTDGEVFINSLRTKTVLSIFSGQPARKE